jgi:hypothetical protein
VLSFTIKGAAAAPIEVARLGELQLKGRLVVGLGLALS